MKKTEGVFYCDFCAKNQYQIAHLVAGPNNIAICDECVTLCAKVIAKKPIDAEGQRQQQPIETRKENGDAN